LKGRAFASGYSPRYVQMPEGLKVALCLIALCPPAKVQEVQKDHHS